MSQPYDPQQPVQPRKTHKVRNTLLSIAAALIALTAISIALGGGHKPAASPAAASSTVDQAPLSNTTTTGPSPAAPAPSPTPAPPTKVTFVISGYAPGDGYGNGPTINYGSDSSTHEADPADINGTLTYTMPFDPSAEYYSLNAQLIGTGHLSCKIVVTGPGDQPLTVSKGTAEGGYSVCSAQAAPSDPSGLNWQDER